jgi:TRAP-type C4-dicarboxylate transport system permease large subunit
VKPPANPMLATMMAAMRFLLAILLPIGVQRGWFGETDAANVSALASAGATILYGLWKTHDRQRRLVGWMKISLALNDLANPETERNRP